MYFQELLDDQDEIENDLTTIDESDQEIDQSELLKVSEERVRILQRHLERLKSLFEEERELTQEAFN